MNYKDNEPPTIQGYGLDNNHDSNNIDQYPPRYNSPDSDSASSTASIFSSDGKSSQSSPVSSPVKSERSWNGERYASTDVPIEPRTSIPIQQLVNQEPGLETKINPRRTQSSSQSSVCQTQSRCPPQLIRQSDRTQNFVENLVDTSTQMIEVIWPLSISHCDKDYLGGKNLIGLRTFIQEVLKRSKTSYYTLQVALYYLVLIKPCVPKVDFTQQRTELTHAQRAMQCGRRMFLAALILASKYLQDRNYSARAWSKISGLKVSEINCNEMTFVTAVDWKLHIPEPQFRRWANIVFKYSTSQTASAPLECRDPNRMTWQQIVPRLTPELDEVDIERFSRLSLKGLACGLVPQSNSIIDLTGCSTVDGDKTPTPVSIGLAPPSTVSGTSFQSPPLSPRIPALPTPVMTPQMKGYYPPAARTWSTGQSMRETMHKIQQQSFTNYSTESWPTKPEFLIPKRPLTRVMSNQSIISSPESMVSDISQNSYSSRTSRSSSICSTASSIGALNGGYHFNPTANHRSALATLNGPNCKPCMVTRRPEPQIMPVEAYTSHDNAEMDATLALLNLARPEKWSNSITCKIQSRSEPGQKRARPLSIADNNISEEVRQMLMAEHGNRNDNTVLPDAHSADSFVLKDPNMINQLLSGSKSNTGSQAGARKKQRNGCRTAPLVAASPIVNWAQ